MCYSTYAGKRLMTLVYRAMVDRAGIDRVLDIGPGQGLYSRLMRPMAPQVAWSCIEIHAPYVSDLKLNELYDRVFIGDVYNLDFSALGNRTAVIAGDVLEHMSVGRGYVVVERAVRHCGFLMTSIPIGDWPQDEAFGNPYEKHVSTWTYEDVTDLPWHVHTVITWGDRKKGIATSFFASDPEVRKQMIEMFSNMSRLYNDNMEFAANLEVPVSRDQEDAAFDPMASTTHSFVERFAPCL